jgi:hypothetical protein
MHRRLTDPKAIDLFNTLKLSLRAHAASFLHMPLALD